MSIGNSGSMVIEVDKDLKKRLYSALAKDGMSMFYGLKNERSKYVSREWVQRSKLRLLPNGTAG